MPNRIALFAMILFGFAVWTPHAQAPGGNFDKWWTPQNDALVAAPQHHKVIFENDEVRVLEVTIKPGVKEPLHAHRYPSVIYFEGPAHLFEYAPDGTKEDRGVREHGAVRWLPIAPPHALENVDTRELRAIRVELKKER